MFGGYVQATSASHVGGHVKNRSKGKLTLNRCLFLPCSANMHCVALNTSQEISLASFRCYQLTCPRPHNDDLSFTVVVHNKSLRPAQMYYVND